MRQRSSEHRLVAHPHPVGANRHQEEFDRPEPIMMKAVHSLLQQRLRSATKYQGKWLPELSFGIETAAGIDLDKFEFQVVVGLLKRLLCLLSLSNVDLCTNDTFLTVNIIRYFLKIILNPMSFSIFIYNAIFSLSCYFR